jgi:uncharacterized protein (DUF2235 family)
LRGGAFGKGLGAHVREAYRSIVDNYEPGDEIFLFGYSRGAFTVRSTGGLIRRSGVLRREHRERIGEAYRLYRRRDPAAKAEGKDALAFRAAFSHEPRIRFIGVWDTVGSLGIPAGIPWFPVTVGLINRRWAFHDTECSDWVDYAYQALAIDERRPQFAPTLWTQPADQIRPTMEQVWFAGVHSNVGGGCADCGLSDLAFLWMMEKASVVGLAFDEEFVRATFKPMALGQLGNSKTGLYRLFRDHVRPIDGPIDDPKRKGLVSFQSVHPSAFERQDRSKDPAYAPENLLDFLRRQAKR